MSEENFILTGPPVGKVPDCSLGEFLMSKICLLPQDKIIHVEADTGATQNVKEFQTRSIRLAVGLKNLGLKENDVVGMLCRNSLEANEMVFAIWLNAAVLAPMPGTMTVDEMIHNLKIVKPKFVFCEEQGLKNLTEALKLLSIDAKIILVGSDKTSVGSFVTYEEVLAEVDTTNYKPPTVKSPSTQLVATYFSSGTSGLPKAVGITHKCLVLQCMKMEIMYLFNPELIFLQTSQFFWVTATLMLISTIMSGLMRILIRDVTVANVLKAIEKYKVNFLFSAPSFTLSLCTSPEFEKYDTSTLTTFSLGGSPFTPEMGEKFKEKWSGATFVQSYGTTEVAGNISCFYKDEDPFSVGKVAPGVQLKVIDTTTGKPLKANTRGEILVKSQELMAGYLNNEEATKEAIDEDGWFHTGDLGYYDESGQLYLVDRLKEMIKVMNMQVSPTEVENVILSLPGVAEVCVAGVTKDGSSEEIVALVVKKDKSKVTKEDILAHTSKFLSEYKRPTAGIFFVESIPKTGSGKVKRKAVRDLAQELYSKQ